jgi:hypothetical protein
LWSMTGTTTRDTILQTVSIQSGQHLWRLSEAPSSEGGGVCQGTRRLPKGRRSCIWCPPAEICCSPVPRYKFVQRSDVGDDELLCVYLHNMIIENERKYPVPLSEQTAPYEREGPLAQPNHQVSASWLRSSLCVRRFETPQCINSCRMIWWSTYRGFEATQTSFHLIFWKLVKLFACFVEL